MEITIKGGSVHYEIYGSGRPVLMIHGWAPDHRLMTGCMEPVFQSLDQPWQRIYLDLPGMGLTKRQNWITGSDQMLELLLDFIDAVIPDQPFLIAGESYGGYLARGIVKRRQAMVDGLLLICPVAFPETQFTTSPPLQVLEEDPSVFANLSDEEIKSFGSITVRRTWPVLNRCKEEILPGLKLADHDFLNNYLGQHVPYSFNVDDLEEPFQKPALMLTGRQDSAVGYRDLWQIIEVYPRASFIVLDKAGHNLQIEQEQLFNELVKEWLGRVTSEVK